MSATIVEAVVKLASKVKGEAVKPANATIAAALDALADALAGENVQAKPTIAAAIDVITENYTPGGGGTTEFWLWNASEDAGAVTQYVGVSRAVGFDLDNDAFITEPLTVEQVTTTYGGQTIYGVHVTDVPIGSLIVVAPPQSFVLIEYSMNYALASFPPYGTGNFNVIPTPMDGFVISGTYLLESAV